MIQLMENVYIDLNLEETWEHPDNKGWRELFLRWSALPQLKLTWKATHAAVRGAVPFLCPAVPQPEGRRDAVTAVWGSRGRRLIGQTFASTSSLA